MLADSEFLRGEITMDPIDETGSTRQTLLILKPSIFYPSLKCIYLMTLKKMFATNHYVDGSCLLF